MKEVLIASTGVANLASIAGALRRIGAEPRFTESAADVDDASAVVLPGVGSFEPARTQLARTGMDRALRERIEGGLPTLAICLGFQLLCEGSEEAPEVAGLGCIPGRLQRLQAMGDDVRVPHLGWTRVRASRPSFAADASLMRDGYACFAHSFALLEQPRGWQASVTRHGQDFVAAVERGPVLACQFHPELSASWGEQLLQRWLRSAMATV